MQVIPTFALRLPPAEVQGALQGLDSESSAIISDAKHGLKDYNGSHNPSRSSQVKKHVTPRSIFSRDGGCRR